MAYTLRCSQLSLLVKLFRELLSFLKKFSTYISEIKVTVAKLHRCYLLLMSRVVTYKIRRSFDK